MHGKPSLYALVGTLVIMLTIAWWLVWRPIVLMREVGLDGWRPESGRQCTEPAYMPARYCNSPGTAASGGPAIRETVQLDRLTGRVTEVFRSQVVTDSVVLSRLQDSLASALTQHGGTVMHCVYSSPIWNRQSGLAAWHLREQDIVVITSRLGKDTEPRQPAWVVQISGSPGGYTGCQGRVRARRLATPEEMVAAVVHWFMGDGERTQ